MTPAARVQTAIELLEEWDRTHQPADRLLQRWGRTHRYAGSKDRTAINAHVYTVLRRRNELAAAIGSETPRALTLAALHVIDGLSVGDIALIAHEGPHAAGALTDAERDALAAAQLPGPDAPRHMRCNYPLWLEAELEAAFASGLEAEMAAMTGRAPLDLRVNLLKTDRVAAQTALQKLDIMAAQTPWSPWGLRLPDRTNIMASGPYREGLVEIQDEGSQIACLAAGAMPGEQIVDLCAGGGGKTLALAAAMANKGQIYACDIDARRLGRLAPRLERAGVRNAQRRLLPLWRSGPDPDLDDLTARADCVFIDAPCSGTGTWRRAPDARWRLTPEDLETYRQAQRDVLDRAARLVRPGGRLVYVTCSFLPSENTAQIERFRDAHPAFTPMPWDNFWPLSIPKPPSLLARPGGSAHSLQLTPKGADTDGFFVAIMRREET